MPNSAPALGLDLRLRSQRVRSDRSQLSTARLALVAVALAALGGLAGATLREQSAVGSVRQEVASTSAPATEARPSAGLNPHNQMLLPGVHASRLLGQDEQRYADALWAIHTQFEHTIAWVGLGTAFYRSQEIDRGELHERLNQGLASYRRTERQIIVLDPPPALRASHEDYLAAVRLFQASALEMLKMYDDGDDEHLSAALPYSLDGTSKLREISARFWPDSYPAS